MVVTCCLPKKASTAPLVYSLRIGCVLSLVLVLFACSTQLPDQVELETALERAEAALAQVEVRGDVGFLVGQGARLAGRELDLTLDSSPLPGFFADLVPFEFALWNRRGRPLAQVMDTQVRGNRDEFDPDFLADPEDKSDQRRGRRVIALVRDAINCSPMVRPDSLSAAPDYGYVVTHQLLALLLAENQGCFDKDELARRAHPYINRIYNEMMAFRGPVNDLQGERAAVLSIIGRFDLVPVKLVRELVDIQYGDGLWVFGELERASLNVALHNTAMAYVVISAAYAEQQ